jgi:hypothetical protein
MELLSRELKDATVVSIGHRAELADFHDRKIILRRGESGAGLVGDAHPLRSPDAPDCFAALQGSCASATTGLYQLLVQDVRHSASYRAAHVSVKLRSPSFSIEVTSLSPDLSQICLSLG